jgi:hypothetical protein
MAVSNTAFTTNSFKITIQDELTGSNNIISEANTAITSLGWDLYDSVDQTDFSPMVTRVYRAENFDGVTYKYAIFRWDTLLLRINLSTCESWNTTTKAATNESWHSDGCFYHGYDVKDSFIFISATPRHLLFQTWILNEPGHWSGIFEAERVAGEDISSNSAPCFFYTNSLMFGTPWGVEGDRRSNTSSVMVAFPRTPDNQTGPFAAGVYAPTTSRGMWPPYYPSGNTGNLTANVVYSTWNMDFNSLHLGSWHQNIGAGAGPTNINGQIEASGINTKTGVWGWDGGSIPVSTISVDAIQKHMPFGRIYDMAVTQPIGNQLDVTNFAANSNTGLVEYGGSNTEFIILPLNGGHELWHSNNYTLRTGVRFPTINNSGIDVSWSNNSSVVYTRVAMIGNNVWAGANNGVWVWDMGTGTNTAASLIYLNSNGVYDIMYDGKRSVYGTTNAGLIKIDTETYQTTVISSGEMQEQGGCGYLNMDNKYVYATNRDANTRPFCHTVYRANNTVNPNYIRMASTVSLNAASGWGTPEPDYNGSVYLTSTAGTTGSNQLRILLANSDSGGEGTANIITPWFTQAASNKSTSLQRMFIEHNSGQVYVILALDGSGHVIEFSPGTLTEVSNTVMFGTSFYSQTANSQMAPTLQGGNTFDFRGDLDILQHRGFFTVQPKAVSKNLPIVHVAGWFAKFVLHHPKPHYSYTNKIAGQLSRIYDVASNPRSSAIGYPAATGDLLGPACHSYTNGIRIVNQHFISNAESRLQVQKGYYSVTPFGGYPTSRILIKG